MSIRFQHGKKVTRNPAAEVRVCGAITPEMAAKRKAEKAARSEEQKEIDVLHVELRQLEIEWARKEAQRRSAARFNQTFKTLVKMLGE